MDDIVKTKHFIYRVHFVDVMTILYHPVEKLENSNIDEISRYYEKISVIILIISYGLILTYCLYLYIEKCTRIIQTYVMRNSKMYE